MKSWERFKNYKERGEWVELRFMAEAVEQGLKVSKPWGDSAAYDVGIEHEGRYVRVQVKSTTCKTAYGYLCQFKPNPRTKAYSLKELDFFAAFVIPENAWYVLPAGVLLGVPPKRALTLFPVNPRHPERYGYECYREAWGLFGQEKGELTRFEEGRVERARLPMAGPIESRRVNSILGGKP